MIASFTKWDNSLSGTLGAGPLGVPLSEVLLYIPQTLSLDDNKVKHTSSQNTLAEFACYKAGVLSDTSIETQTYTVIAF